MEDEILGKYSNFWDLTTEYAVVIPIIQRDYAQGRNNDNVRQIRVKFVRQLLHSMLNSIPMELDFVYGSVEQNLSLELTNDIINEFTPLDGQQRLTTLFLVHWFLSLWNENDYIDFRQHILHKFRYKTRSSSSDFCENIINFADRETILTNIKCHTKMPISSAITDEGWFHYMWKNDPTISGMLTVLDCLAEEFSKISGDEIMAHDFYISLKPVDNENAPKRPLISFHLLFLNKGSFKMSDELYIKMNSRGKPLTDFETFKARFENFMDNDTFTKSESFSHLIDHEWADTFWNIRNLVQPTNIEKPINRDNTDQMLMNIINAVLATQYASQTLDTTSEALETIFNTKVAKDKNYDTRLTFYRYTELGILYNNVDKLDEPEEFRMEAKKSNNRYASAIVNTFDVVNNLLNNSYCIDQKVLDVRECLFKHIFDNIDGALSQYNNLTYSDRIYFYALTQYIIRFKPFIAQGTEQDLPLARWIRFIRNIVENTEISGAEQMNKFCFSLEKLLNDLEINQERDIIIYLSQHNNYIEIPPVPQSQVNEETIKAKLIIANSQWEKLIIEADNIEQWPGRTGYLLYMAGLVANAEQIPSLEVTQHFELQELFKEYFDKINLLLESYLEYTDEYTSNVILERALLAQDGLYMRPYPNSSVLRQMMDVSVSGRTNSWRQMLQYNGINNDNSYKGGVDALQQLLDDTALKKYKEMTPSQVKDILLNIIQQKAKNLTDSWKWPMLDDPSIWGKADKNYRLIRYYQDWVTITEKASKNTLHYESWTIHLYMRLRAKEYPVYYYPHEDDCIYINFKKNDSLHQITINHVKKEWSIFFKSYIDEKFVPLDQQIVETLWGNRLINIHPNNENEAYDTICHLYQQILDNGYHINW